MNSSDTMELSFLASTDASRIAFILFVLMIISIFVGRKIGYLKKQGTGQESAANSTILSAMLGLLAFLLAFTFGMSGSRYDSRRSHIINEANAIGTAILRADLYSDVEREAFRNDFKLYLETRIRYYEENQSLAEILKIKKEADALGAQIWKRCTRLSKDSGNSVASLQMTTALNEMLDISTTRYIAELSRVPDSIVWMLLVLSLSAAFYVGYVSSGKALDWLMVSGFCILTSVVVYITLDLDRPRRGLIQLSTSHKAMVELREMFN